jgi:hypothetical protein
MAGLLGSMLCGASSGESTDGSGAFIVPSAGLLADVRELAQQIADS